jgi:membrane associated rhomboid family serine protease
MIDCVCDCGKPLKVSEQLVGKIIPCPACGRKVHLACAEALAEGSGAGDFDGSLTVIAGPALLGEQFLLGGVMEIGLGKLESNLIRLPGSLVSRAHARMVRVDFGPSRWKVVDCGSRNGLFVNGQKVVEAELTNGDSLRIGEFEFQYRNTFEQMMAAAPAEVPGEAAGGIVALVQECPSCGKGLSSKTRICIACGIDVKSGRPMVISQGVDEDSLHVHARQIIQVASFLMWATPLPIPIASEAYGAIKPWTIRVIAILTVLSSFAFYFATRGDRFGGKELLLWPPPRLAAHAAPRQLTNRQLERLADELDKEDPGWMDDVAQEQEGKMNDQEIRREAARRWVAALRERAHGEFHWYQLITHAFLHDNSSIFGLLMHLGGNMLFLMVFGTRVNALIGNIATAILYPILAVASGAAHLFFQHGSAGLLGTSGAIQGLAGMYLILFPLQRVYCAMWLKFWIFRPAWIGIFTLRSFWVLLIYFAYDSLMVALNWGGGTAHWAHIGGFVTGAALGVGILASRMFNCRGDLPSVLFGRYVWFLTGKPSRWNAAAA